MRIVIAKTEAAGGGTERFTTDPSKPGYLMHSYEALTYGLKVEYPNGDTKLYPWANILFVERLQTS